MRTFAQVPRTARPAYRHRTPVSPRLGGSQADQEVEADRVGALLGGQALGRGTGERIASGGSLPPDVRTHFESRLGHDLAGVRIHHDAGAAGRASERRALAFTEGNHITFNRGAYAPHTDEGRSLLAHELTHVVQQRQGAPRTQDKLQVGAGLTLDTKGFTTSKAGDTYTCPAVVKSTIWNELFTSLLHSPRIFKLAGTTNAKVNDNLQKHMTTRKDIIDFAAKKKYTFAAGAAFKMNPAFWVKDAATDSWNTKPGVTRHDAILDLNVHPEEYRIACEAATVLTMQSAQSPLVNNPGGVSTDWVPGSWGYITNTKFPAVGGTPGLEGENLIYVGKGKFWGHFGPGVEYKTLQQWFDQVQSWHGGARIEDQRTHPNAGLA